MGEPTQTIGTSLSRTCNLVNKPKENKPSKGPYVYPAKLNTAAIIKQKEPYFPRFS